MIVKIQIIYDVFTKISHFHLGFPWFLLLALGLHPCARKHHTKEVPCQRDLTYTFLTSTRIEVHFTNTYNFEWLKKTHTMPCIPCKLHTLAIKIVNSCIIKIVAQSFQHNSNWKVDISWQLQWAWRTNIGINFWFRRVVQSPGIYSSTSSR